MAFPFYTEYGAESGTSGHFDAQSPSSFTTGAFYYHYSDLAAIPGLPAPWAGAFCFGCDLSGFVTEQYLQETGSWDTASSSTITFRYMLWVGGTGFTMANGDEFSVMQQWTSTNTVVADQTIRYNGTNYQLGLGQPASAYNYLDFSLNRWHAIELKLVPGGSGVGTVDAWLDGSGFTQVLTPSSIMGTTSGVIGVRGKDSGTTRGWVLFDDLIADDAQIYFPRERFPRSKLMTNPGHVFVGPGVVADVELLSGVGTDNVIQLFDTDTGNINDFSAMKAEIKNINNSAMVDVHLSNPIEFVRGCYVHMTGTNPRALVHIGRAAGYWSDGKIRDYGLRRQRRPQNV